MADDMPEYRQVEPVLAAKMIADQRLVDPGRLGDGAGAGGIETRVAKHVQRREYQEFAGLVTAGWGFGRRHDGDF